ncbi:hypothetical protein [Caballeronia sp. J97]|uniref:hypothetical protein n=1 Tax=Caballeronia sp. J97 TaxID=2805429 RepID=UPI002AB30886|nr:hypothetical protein [Caballeronia sp. J97]
MARVNIASAIVLGKFQNNSYFFGIAGLQNYGLLNDPRLSPSLTPGANVFNANASGPWVTNGALTATANEIYTDIQTLFNALALQSGGLIEMDARMTPLPVAIRAMRWRISASPSTCRRRSSNSGWWIIRSCPPSRTA